MANTGSQSNNGNQQVSIYSQQQLSSIYGNQLLYGILQAGVANTSVTVAYSAPNLVFTIAAGTELFFQRSTSVDPASQGTTNTFIVKVILGSNATCSILNTTWNGGSYVGSSKLYIIADWQYTAGYDYASFVIANDTTISSYNFVGNNSISNGNQVLVAVILNNIVAESHAPSWGSVPSYFHISYEGQAGRDILTKVNNKNDQFLVQFAGDGSGIYVSQGNNFVGDTFLSPEILTSTIWSSAAHYPTSTDAIYSNKITPPILNTTYMNNVTTGATITIASGVYANYYQIDFLRCKYDEVSHVQNFYWESFVQPANGFSFVYGSTTQQNLIDYLSAFSSFPIKGIGQTILATVRRLDAVNTANLLWPESTLFFKGSGLTETPGVNFHSRFKLPVWTASDLGLS